MSSSLLRYRLSRGVQSTISPPYVLIRFHVSFIELILWFSIPQAWAWAASFTPTPTRPLLDVSQGAPSAPPPPALLRALADAAGAPASAGYSNPRGDPELPRAVTAEMREVYGRGGAEVDVADEDIAVTAGCNMAYVAAVMTLADAGDEIILPVPWCVLRLLTTAAWR
jgi:aspartate/methionine/tyrosine aminotransferase